MSMRVRHAAPRGGVTEQGTRRKNTSPRPVNQFVATVFGSPPMNFIPCTVAARNGSLSVRHSLFEVELKGEGLSMRESLTEGARCLLGIRPEDIRVGTGGGEGFPATVYVTEPLGGETVVDLRLGDRVVKALAPPSVELVQDAPVRVSLDPL